MSVHTSTGLYEVISDDLAVFKCSQTSYMDLCEDLVANAEARRPLHRICAIMRRRRSDYLLLHRNVQRSRNFKKHYPALYLELHNLRNAAGRNLQRVEVVQLSFFVTRDGRGLVKFFSNSKGNPSGLPPKLEATALLIRVHAQRGCACTSYVYEALVAVPSTPPYRKKISADGISSHIHVFQRADAVVAERAFQLSASYYCQQNQLTSTCAHCCLKMSLWHLGLGESFGENQEGYQPNTAVMNDIAERHFQSSERRKAFVPGAGLQRGQIEAICDHYGAHAFRIEFTTQSQPHYANNAYELAYLFAESGIPTLMLFKTKDGEKENEVIRHMVPVIGHTLNNDEWFPSAVRHYPYLSDEGLLTSITHKMHLPSVEWVPHLVLHDDVLGPYYSVRPGAITDHIADGRERVGRVVSIVAIVPKNSGWNRSPVLAHEAGRKLFWNLWHLFRNQLPGRWSQRLVDRWGSQRSRAERARELVLRTQIVRKAEYIRHLSAAPDFGGRKSGLDSQTTNEIRAALAAEPKDHVWMVEFTLPDLYTGNLTKIGELLLPLAVADPERARKIMEATEQDELTDVPLAIRMFGNLKLLDPSDSVSVTYNTKRLLYRSHVPLYVRASRRGKL